MLLGGLTAANCTVCIWEGVKDTLLNVSRFKRYFEDYSDLIAPCRTVEDIRSAKAMGRVGIVLGWQNSSGAEDRIELLSVFKELGVGFTDMTDGQDEAFFQWIRKDKGHGRRMVPANGVAPKVQDFGSLADYPHLTQAMCRRGWSQQRIENILGENWLRFLGEVW